MEESCGMGHGGKRGKRMRKAVGQERRKEDAEGGGAGRAERGCRRRYGPQEEKLYAGDCYDAKCVRQERENSFRNKITTGRKILRKDSK